MKKIPQPDVWGLSSCKVSVQPIWRLLIDKARLANPTHDKRPGGFIDLHRCRLEIFTSIKTHPADSSFCNSGVPMLMILIPSRAI
ncbi:MAG: hypothetical protein LBF37_01060 [Rickettsiales bacterium]|nr:hypothetical protein [Rickettsiales bacterium]